jgi:hypothetical protein
MGREINLYFQISFGQAWTLTMWIMCLLETPESQASAEELGYQTEKYGESPGLYYEKLGEKTLYNTEWKTIIYLNLGQTDREIDQIGQYINHKNQLCRVTEI